MATGLRQNGRGGRDSGERNIISINTYMYIRCKEFRFLRNPGFIDEGGLFKDWGHVGRRTAFQLLTP